MRHRKKTVKLQRRQGHRDSLLNNLCKSLIEHRRIRTTLAKAKALRPIAEKLVTLGKRDSIHTRRQAFAVLRDKTLVKNLFDEISSASKDRKGGYTRITKLGPRMSDSAPMAFIEWVDAYIPASASAAEDASDASKKSAAKAGKTSEEAEAATK